MLEQIIFIDIETVPKYKFYSEMPLALQKIWDRKYEQLNMQQETPAEAYLDRAGIYAEFGKVIVIGLGYFFKAPDGLTFRMTALQNDDEKRLLEQFRELLVTKFPPYRYRFCAHNGKEFDYPYLCRRMIVNQIELPIHLDLRGKKPWEVKHLDTLELWKFGDFKHYTSLDLLCHVLDVPTSKKDIDGSQVADKYYNENALDKISDYCLNDVLATARIYQRLMNQPLIKESDISVLDLV